MPNEKDKDFRKLKIKAKTIKNPYGHFDKNDSAKDIHYEASFLGSFNSTDRSIDFDEAGGITRFGFERFLPNGPISLRDLRAIIEDLTALESAIREAVAADNL